LEEKFKGIVISSKDYKDKDKIATIFSLEKGLINVVLKSVKSFKAKLKIAKEPFCFGEFLVVNKNGNNLLIDCNIIDTFHNLSQDIDKYIEASAIFSIIKDINAYGRQDVALFLETLTAFKCLAYESPPKSFVLIKFLIKIFETMGYKLNLHNCAICGDNFFGKKFFCLDTGEICCIACKPLNCIEISPKIHTILRIISNTEYSNLSTLKFDINDTLNLLELNYKLRFNREILNLNKFN